MTAVNGASTTLIGNYKTKYAPKLNFLWQQNTWLAQKFVFSSENKVGKDYRYPVDLAGEQGITYAANNVLPSVASGTYLPPIAGVSQESIITPWQMHGRSSVAYVAETASQDREVAFLDAQKMVMRRLTLQSAKRHEFACINGARGWGQTSGTPATGATRTVPITAATWADGTFIGSIGMPLDVYSDSSGAPSGTKVSTGTSNGGDAITISAINYETKTLTLTVPNATDQSLALTSTWLFPELASITREMPGLAYIGANTGTYANISAATYPEWKANTQTSIGTLDFSTFMSGLGQMAPWFDQMGINVMSLVSPRNFNNLVTDQAALRQYDVSYSADRAKTGFRGLTFTAFNAIIELMGHAMVRNSEYLACVPEEVIRPGSCESEFIQRANGQETIVLESADSPSGEMRNLTDLSLLVLKPRHLLFGSGITTT